MSHLIALCFVSLVCGCKLFEVPQSTSSELQGGFDNHHVLMLKSTSPDRAEFEVCLIEPSTEKIQPLEGSCINPYHVVDVSGSGGKVPLQMSVEHIKERELSPDELAYVIDRQKQVVEYVDDRNDVGTATGVSIAGMFFSAMKAGSILHNTRHIRGQDRWNLVFSLVLLAGSAMHLKFAQDKADDVYEAKKSLEGEGLPSILSNQPHRWLVLLENFDHLTGVDSDSLVELGSLENQLGRLGILLHLRKFVPSPYRIVEFCVPKHSNDTLSEFLTVCKPII